MAGLQESVATLPLSCARPHPLLIIHVDVTVGSCGTVLLFLLLRPVLLREVDDAAFLVFVDNETRVTRVLRSLCLCLYPCTSSLTHMYRFMMPANALVNRSTNVFVFMSTSMNVW